MDLHNINQKITADEIFVLMMLPGLDMTRLFVQRLLNKKNPFIGDRNHFHHLLHDNYGYSHSIKILSLFIFLPIICLFFLNVQIIVLIYILIYISALSKIYKN